MTKERYPDGKPYPCDFCGKELPENLLFDVPGLKEGERNLICADCYDQLPEEDK